MSTYGFTFSGWLLFIKKMSQEEISALFDNTDMWQSLEREYCEWDQKYRFRKQDQASKMENTFSLPFSRD